jgi:hypothetical protein
MARYEYYMNSWLHTLQEMIDTELILIDAKDKEIKITSGDIREEMEHRFGPNMLSKLDELDLQYEEARTMIQNELIARQMNWYKVQSKAVQSVSPQDIRNAYRKYCDEHPPSEEFVYQVVSLRADDIAKGEELSKKAHATFLNLQDIQKAFQEISQDPQYQDKAISLQLSEEYQLDEKSLSKSHRDVLISLAPNKYSDLVSQVNRIDGKTVFRIFYLKSHRFNAPASFGEISEKIQEALTQAALEKENTLYLSKIRSRHGFDEKFFNEMIAKDFQPFVIR